MKSPLTCIIVDDEPIARSITEKYLTDYPILEVVSTFNAATTALQFLTQQSVDVMFLDINMPKLTGMEMLRSLPVKPLTVITTAYQEYALESFELDVVDYLLKPFSFERFIAAVNRCKERLESNDTVSRAIEDDFLIVKQDRKFHKINLATIMFIESIGDYVKFNLTDGKVIIGNQTMKSLENHLPLAKFMRIHKSFIISIDHITGMFGNIIEIGKKEIPVGESFRQKIKQFIDDKSI